MSARSASTMPETDRERAHRAWRNAQRIKHLSDDLIRIGPWGLGLDGVLAWIPAANTIYSVGAGSLLLYEAWQARAAPWTLTRMVAYLAANTATTEVPILGWAMDTLFRGHAMAANALQKDIAARWGAPGDRADSQTSQRRSPARAGANSGPSWRD